MLGTCSYKLPPVWRFGIGTLDFASQLSISFRHQYKPPLISSSTFLPQDKYS